MRERFVSGFRIEQDLPVKSLWIRNNLCVSIDFFLFPWHNGREVLQRITEIMTWQTNDSGRRCRPKKIELFFRQKQTLDQFLERHAISQAQYDKSLHDLIEKMGMQDVCR